jgi:hypothetical protein
MIATLYQPWPLALGGVVFVALFLGPYRGRPSAGLLLLPAAAWLLAALDR